MSPWLIRSTVSANTGRPGRAADASSVNVATMVRLCFRAQEVIVCHYDLMTDVHRARIDEKVKAYAYTEKWIKEALRRQQLTVIP